jgi:membrane protein implicated in regulation of membrane protease activity
MRLFVTVYPAFAIGWLVTFLLLIIEHMLWKDQPRLVRYLLGGGTICLGCSVAGAILESMLLGFGAWVIASAGLIVIYLTWQDQRTSKAKQAAAKRGEIIGATKGLTQEIIDGGGERSQHQN